jgi:uncharacterized integral membrane protein
MKRLSWIVTLPLMLVVVVFSLANRGPVSLDLWPFKESITLPLFVPLLVAVFIGLVIGGVVAWFSGGKKRRRARDLRFDKAHLEREVIRLNREVERAKSAGSAEPPPASPALPPSAGNGSGHARSLSSASGGR